MKEFLDKYGDEIAVGIKWILMSIGVALILIASSYHQVNRLNAQNQNVKQIDK